MSKKCSNSVVPNSNFVACCA